MYFFNGPGFRDQEPIECICWSRGVRGIRLKGRTKVRVIRFKPTVIKVKAIMKLYNVYEY